MSFFRKSPSKSSERSKKSAKPPSSRERDMGRDEAFMSLYMRCKPYTMTTMERLYALYHSVAYIVRSKVPGDIVECGVWRGGSMMMAALSLMRFSEDRDRRLYLYDTFEGMPRPTGADYKFGGEPAEKMWLTLWRGGGSDWNYASLDEVREVMRSTDYGEDRIHFIKGKVEQTIPGNAPDSIALLRLDTDFYDSTRHALEHLYPRLSRGGVLIIDDFGTWAGAHRAVEEYFEKERVRMLLVRLDAGARIGVKQHGSDPEL